jgi:NTP pyrophosphatase (non-canonical NTP hydrolase)
VNLRELQEAVRGVDIKRFPKAPSYLALIKVQEELGELSDAFIAQLEIREGKETTRDMGLEAADIIIALMTFCERENIDLQVAVEEKWRIVSQRTYSLTEKAKRL